MKRITIVLAFLLCATVLFAQALRNLLISR